jgi:hypothetical protein
MIGEVVAPEWLERRATLAAFADTESEAVARCGQLVAEGPNRPSPWEQLKQQVFLGSQAFVDAMRRSIPPGRYLRDVPQAKPRPVARSLPEYARAHASRKEAIAAAYASGAYTLRQIGDFFGLYESRISRLVRGAQSPEGRARVRTPDAPDDIVVELAQRLLGKGWQERFLRQVADGGIKRVLL